MTKSSFAKRRNGAPVKKRILRLAVHAHNHRRFAGIRGGKKSAQHSLKQDAAAPSTPSIAPSSYASMF